LVLALRLGGGWSRPRSQSSPARPRCWIPSRSPCRCRWSRWCRRWSRVLGCRGVYLPRFRRRSLPQQNRRPGAEGWLWVPTCRSRSRSRRTVGPTTGFLDGGSRSGGSVGDRSPGGNRAPSRDGSYRGPGPSWCCSGRGLRSGGAAAGWVVVTRASQIAVFDGGCLGPSPRLSTMTGPRADRTAVFAPVGGGLKAGRL
jgi:hypothetical protein